jgi:eukaryotic-like serine/threonine-protein kinase
MNLTPGSSAARISGRYEIYSQIGCGATSVVYKAFDLDKNLIVALKSLRFSQDPEEVYYLKQEFRSLSDIYHPNLAQLYELEISEGRGFITMELIEGVDFVSFARRPQTGRSSAGRGDEFAPLRLALGHAIRGLTALHARGKLHRDIKPSNVLVEPTGRAVLVDFGLSLDLRASDATVSQARMHAGTLAYLSPERLEGAPASETSDWYSVGAMLYQALLGLPPFRAETPVALYEAQRKPPIAPHVLDENIPKDLSDLSLALLQRDPAARLTGAEVPKLADFGIDAGTHGYSSIPLSLSKDVFVGRSKEKERLRQAFKCSRQESVTVLVEGVSGVGKTALIEQFVSSAYDSDRSLVLRSRCHLQEAVQYNAVDGLIDNLSRFLVLQPPEYLAAATPWHLYALLKLFPVLARVQFPRRDDLPQLASDPHEVTRQALEALQELLLKVTEQRPLIVWIDDAQWCDLASISVLREVFTRSRAPNCLLIISFRSEDRDNDVVSRLSGSTPDAGLPPPLDRIVLSPLSKEEIQTLIAELGGLSLDPDDGFLKQVDRDTGGLPLFVVELACHHRTTPSQAGQVKVTTDVGSLIKERLVSLPETLQSLLKIVAVSNGPLEEEVLLEIAGTKGAGAVALYRLCRDHLLRKSMVRGQWSLESYHDRIRQIVLGLLNADGLRDLHGRIAEALRTRPSADAQALVEHYLGAGNRPAAAEYALIGGRNAAERLAFDRAADLFGLAVDLRERGAEDWPLLKEQAQALANAGRTEEAAHTYLNTAASAKQMGCHLNEISAVEVRAAEQFLTGGRLSQGELHLRDVFKDLQLPFPGGPRRANLRSLWNRLMFQLSLKRIHPEGLTDTPPEALLRLDTLWIASRNMVMLDYVVGEAMTSWYLTEAVRQSDRSRLLRALALEASVYANIGGRWSFRQREKLLRRANTLLLDSRDPYDRAFVQVCCTSIAWFDGDWRACRDLAWDTVGQLQRDCTGVNWEVTVSLSFGLSAQVFLGELRVLKEKVAHLLDDAARRRDRYVSTVFRSGYLVFLALADDRPVDALNAANATIEEISSDQFGGRFTAMHFHHFNAATNALLYSGRPDDAWSLVEERWPLIRQAGLLHLACIGSLLRDVRARVAVAAAREQSGRERARLVAVAAREADKIAARSLPHAAPMAAAIRAGVAAIRGDAEGEGAALEEAKLGFDLAEMAMHRSAASIRLGRLMGSDKGEEELAIGTAFLEGQGVRRPQAMATTLFPGAK